MIKNPPKGLILLSQPGQLRIEPPEMLATLAEPLQRLHHSVVELDVSQVAREALQTLDWSTAQRVLEERFHRELAPLLERHPGYALVYFGSAPIPLTVQLGFLLETWRPVHVIPHHHVHRRWGWGAEPERPPARLRPFSLPVERDRSPGEAIIRVSTSHLVDVQETRKVVPDALLEVDLSLEHPSEDAFCRQEEMQAVAQSFRDVLDALGDRFQGIHRVHLFASVQPGMALLLGGQISKTMHPPVRTYQYTRSAQGEAYHVPAVEVNRPPRPAPEPLTQEQRARATSDRRQMEQDLERMKGLASRRTLPAREDWLSDLFEPDARRVFTRTWRALPALWDTPLFKTSVDVETGAVEDSFRLAPPQQRWQLDDQWLTRLALRLPEPRERASALRLLVLHELAHRGPQALTRTSSREVGRFPKVLEEIDFQSDVWAMLHEYELTRSQNPREVEDLPRFFMALVLRATECMWAFDDGPPLQEIQVRRLNRYLIWYWEWLLLERLATRSRGGSLEEVLSVLTQRPVLELAGPPLRTHDGRVFFDLSPGSVRAPEFAVYHEGMLHRAGPRPDFPIEVLLEGFREREGGKIRESLRGAFEQIVR